MGLTVQVKEAEEDGPVESVAVAVTVKPCGGGGRAADQAGGGVDGQTVRQAGGGVVQGAHAAVSVAESWRLVAVPTVAVRVPGSARVTVPVPVALPWASQAVAFSARAASVPAGSFQPS